MCIFTWKIRIISNVHIIAFRHRLQIYICIKIFPCNSHHKILWAEFSIKSTSTSLLKQGSWIYFLTDGEVTSFNPGISLYEVVHSRMDFRGAQLTQVVGTLLRLILLKCQSKDVLILLLWTVCLKLKITNLSSKFKYVTATEKKKTDQSSISIPLTTITI